MLSNKVLGVGDELANILAQRGFAAQSQNGTVLGTLAAASAPILDLGCYLTEDAVPVAAANELRPVAMKVLEHTSLEKGADGEFKHGRVLEAMIEQVAKAVRADQDIARNGVNPVIRQIVDAVTTADANRSGEGQLRPDVSPYYYADVWENSSWNGLVSRYADLPVVKCYVPKAIPMPSDCTLKELLTTGVSSIDQDLQALVEARGEDFLGLVWKAVFENAYEPQRDLDIVGKMDSDGWLFSNSRLSVDAVIVAHVFAKALIKRDAPEGFTDQSYNGALSSVVGATGQRLYRSTQQRKQDQASKQLVYAYGWGQGQRPAFTSASQGLILVNGDLYGEFLNAGGSPELLMGAAHTDQQRGLEALLANQEQYLGAYRRFEATVSESVAASRTARILELVRVEVFRYLNSLPETELIKSREQYVMEIRQHLTTFQPKDCDALWFFVRHLVCVVFFPHTNALRTLTKIDDVIGRMPDADLQVVAFHATMEILVDWLMEQISIVKLSA